MWHLSHGGSSSLFVFCYTQKYNKSEEPLLFQLSLAHTPDAQEQYVTAIVQLYTALGGGWNPKQKPAAMPTVGQSPPKTAEKKK